MVQKKQKSAVLYAQLAFFLGWLGIHKIYSGHIKQAFTMLTLFLCSMFCFIIAGVCIYNNEQNLASCFYVPGSLLFLDVFIWAWVDFIKGLCNANTPEHLFGK